MNPRSSLLLSSILLLSLLPTTFAFIQSDNGCVCAVSTTAMSAAASAIGCKTRLGFDNVTIMTWCPTDQVKNPGCGTLYDGFGIIDTCATAGFLTANVLPNQVLIEPGQTQWQFYTHQMINLTWTTTKLENNERIAFQVYTPVLRNILPTTGGGGGNPGYLNITLGSVTTRLTESGFTPLATLGGPVPILFTTQASNSVNANSENKFKNSSQSITILQSRINTVEARWNNILLSTATTVPLDDQVFTVRWTAVGMANEGTATISIQRCGNGGSTCSQTQPSTGSQIGNAQGGINLANSNGVNEFNISLARTTNGVNVGQSYQLLVSVSSSGATYNFGSAGFVMGAMPSATPSSTKTASGSITPSPTPTPTGTPSPTSSVTASTTSTASASKSIPPSNPPDLTAILKKQAEEADARAKKQAEETEAATTSVIGGVVGGTIFACIAGFVIFKVIQRRQSAERRQRKLAATRRATAERESVYGVTIATVDRPSEKDIANLAAYKAATKAQNNPMTKASSLTAPARTVGRGSGRSLNRV
jgi:hypothetical protein